MNVVRIDDRLRRWQGLLDGHVVCRPRGVGLPRRQPILRKLTTLRVGGDGAEGDGGVSRGRGAGQSREDEEKGATSHREGLFTALCRPLVHRKRRGGHLAKFTGRQSLAKNAAPARLSPLFFLCAFLFLPKNRFKLVLPPHFLPSVLLSASKSPGRADGVFYMGNPIQRGPNRTTPKQKH